MKAKDKSEKNKLPKNTDEQPIPSFDDLENLFLDSTFVKSDPTKDIEFAKDFIEYEKESYRKLDDAFKTFLYNFVENQNKKDQLKINLKNYFFVIIMFGFLLLLFTPIIIIGSAQNFSDTTLIVAIISSLAELTAAIIVLPKIIAMYLFDKEEDKNMIAIITNMQNYNEKKHDYIAKEADKQKPQSPTKS